MKKKMKLALAASIFGLALMCVPNAHAACGGVPLPQAHPSSFQLQSGSARLLRASLAEPEGDDDRGGASIVGMWHVTFTSHGSDSDLPEGAPVDNALVVWHGDNTEIMNSDRPPQDGDFCMGVWKQTGRNTYKLNHFAWFSNVYDPTNPLSWSEIGPAAGADSHRRGDYVESGWHLATRAHLRWMHTTPQAIQQFTLSVCSAEPESPWTRRCQVCFKGRPVIPVQLCQGGGI